MESGEVAASPESSQSSLSSRDDSSRQSEEPVGDIDFGMEGPNLPSTRGTPPPPADEQANDQIESTAKPRASTPSARERGEENEQDDDNAEGEDAQDQRPDRFQASASRELAGLQKAAQIYQIPNTLGTEGRQARRQLSSGIVSPSPSASARHTPTPTPPAPPAPRPRGRPPKSDKARAEAALQRAEAALKPPSRRGRKRKLDQDAGHEGRTVRMTPARGNKRTRTMKELSSSASEAESDSTSELGNHNHTEVRRGRGRGGSVRGRQRGTRGKGRSSDDAAATLAALASISRSSPSPPESGTGKDEGVEQDVPEGPPSTLAPPISQGTYTFISTSFIVPSQRIRSLSAPPSPTTDLLAPSASSARSVSPVARSPSSPGRKPPSSADGRSSEEGTKPDSRSSTQKENETEKKAKGPAVRLSGRMTTRGSRTPRELSGRFLSR
jgi:hypothetical protein